MHDVLAHRISLLSVHAGALEFNPAASTEQIAQAASVIRSSARAAQEDLREVIGVLRSDPEDARLQPPQPPQPTIADIANLIEESRHACMDVTFIDQLSDQPLPALAGRTVYRVAQEALTNARKHAPSQTVSISLAGNPGGVLEIEVINRPRLGDSGTSSGEAREQVGSGTSLVGLAERLALAGGTLTHQTLPGGGFQLSATVPWTADTQLADDPPAMS